MGRGQQQKWRECSVVGQQDPSGLACMLMGAHGGSCWWRGQPARSGRFVCVVREERRVDEGLETLKTRVWRWQLKPRCHQRGRRGSWGHVINTDRQCGVNRRGCMRSCGRLMLGPGLTEAPQQAWHHWCKCSSGMARDSIQARAASRSHTVLAVVARRRSAPRQHVAQVAHRLQGGQQAGSAQVGRAAGHATWQGIPYTGQRLPHSAMPATLRHIPWPRPPGQPAGPPPADLR